MTVAVGAHRALGQPPTHRIDGHRGVGLLVGVHLNNDHDESPRARRDTSPFARPGRHASVQPRRLLSSHAGPALRALGGAAHRWKSHQPPTGAAKKRATPAEPTPMLALTRRKPTPPSGSRS